MKSEDGCTIRKIELADHKTCTGCLACANICEFNVIKIINDSEGFYHPKINHDKCVRCGKCMKACPLLQDEERADDSLTMNTFFGKHRKIKERESSQSGGAFWAIAEHIYSDKGVVYGCALDNSFRARHIRTTNNIEGRRLRGSKYVQSYIGRAFRMVEKDLNNGKKVLFSGTPCQVAGLYSYLKVKRIDCSDLITCDLVCHGVPSPKIWLDYLKFIQRKNKKKIILANFRDKEFGWNSHIESVVFQDNKKISQDYYSKLFYNNCILRPSCHNCKYSNKNRVGDITIADCWGIEKYNKRYFDIKGVSLLLVNTTKGEKILKAIEPDFEYRPIENRYIMQHNLQMPTPISPKRNQFWDKYNRRGIEYILRRYTSYGLINRIRRFFNQEIKL